MRKIEMKHTVMTLILVIGGATLFNGSRANAVAAGVESGTFTVLTYNVAGLPQGISSSQPLFFMRKISKTDGYGII